MFDTLKEILVTKLKVSAAAVTPETTSADIDLDSLAMVELSMLLEKEFGIVVTDEELANAPSIGQMARLLEDRSAKV